MSSRDYCECKDCESVLSPSAYLVDLLHNFLDSVPAKLPYPNAVYSYSALIVLTNRRPDLLFLKLNCENALLPIPYLDLVNEVLESCVVYKSSLPSEPNPPFTPEPKPNDTSAGAAADEVAVSPENLDPKAYVPLLNAVYPHNLPFSLWWEKARACLQALGTSRAELLAIFGPGSGADVVLACERLGISSEEHAILSTADAAGNPIADPHPVEDYYGLPSSPYWPPYATLGSVPHFLRSARLEYRDLLRLLQTRHVNPAGVAPEARLFVEANEPCSLDAAVIRNLSSNEQLARIHRFLRLGRRLGHDMLDLDRALQAFGAQDVGDALLLKLDAAQQVAERLKLPLVRVLPLWSTLDTHRYGDELDPYRKLFQNRTAARPVDPCFELTAPPAAPELAGGAGCTMTIEAHQPAIQAALRISAAELTQLAATALPDHDLNLVNLSALHRHALLATALRRPIAELLSLITLFDNGSFDTPQSTLSFLDFCDAVQAAGFTVAELNLLYRDRVPSGVYLPPSPTLIARLLGALEEGLARIEADHKLAVDPTGELTRQKLMVLYEPATAEEIVSLLTGASVWHTPLAEMPSLAVSDELKARLLYLPSSKSLQFHGAMTDAERTELSNGQTPAFQTAILALWAQPRDFVDSTLANFPRSASDEAAISFLDPTTAKDKLLDPAAAPAEKFAFVLDPLLKHLVAVLSRNQVTQTLAEAFHLEPTLTRWLLENGLASRADAGQPAMADFLPPRGLDARYYAGKELAGPAVVSASPQVLADWGGGSPDPSISHASFSAQWSGLLQVPSTDSYTFYVLANDGARLWVDGQLLIDDWNDQPQAERSATISLEAGLQGISLDYYQATAVDSAVRLSWSNSASAKTLIPSSAFRPLDPWRLFHKAALIVSSFRLTVPELAYLAAHPADFDDFDLNQLPLHPSAFSTAVFASWRRLRNVTALRARFGSSTVSIVQIFGAIARAEAITKLSAAAGWNAQELEWLAGPSAMNLADADFRTEAALLRVASCFTLSRKTGVSVRQLWRWAHTGLAGSDGPVIATEMQKALKAVHDDDAWLTVGKALNDSLRDARRNALGSYLLAHPALVRPDDIDPFNPLLKAPEDLYEHLLIDVQMDVCMMTSRIKQAISSVQLFVQRCLLGLEPEVEPGALSAEHWARSMQHYRVWEAARKIFMYAENWLQPQLRDDKTQFFRELETDLLKNELTTENVETAFERYLRKLEDIARPEILGLYVEHRKDPGPERQTRIVHVIARTRSTPHQHYYRRQLDGVRWTAWERVGLDIEGNVALPVMWERRLYLFWPLVAKKALPESDPRAPGQYWEICFAFSERVDEKWTPRRSLNSAIALHDLVGTSGPAATNLSESNFGFKAISAGNKLILQAIVHAPANGSSSGTVHHELVSAIEVSICDGETRVGYPFTDYLIAPPAVRLPGEPPTEDFGERANLVVPALTNGEPLNHRLGAWSWHGTGGSLSAVFGLWEEYGASPLAQGITVRSEELLGFAPAEFELVVPHQYRQFEQQAPYFFQNREHTYFVEPRKTPESTPFGDVNRLEARFFTHHHPAVCHFLTQLQQRGLDGLLSLQTQGVVMEWAPGALFAAYNPSAATVVEPHPQNRIEFDADAAYAIYNWELFFHAPLLIACKLSTDQRFAEAHRWFQYIFNPNAQPNDPTRQRCWNFAPFHLNDPTDPQNGSIQKLLLALSDPTNPAAGQQVRDQLREWADDPFNPHLVARMRLVAYQNAVMMKYVENLIAWADQLFARDTIESINEATPLYVLAAKVWGDKPRAVPPTAKLPALSYAEIGDFDEFAQTVEDLLMFSDPPATGGAANSGLTGGLGTNLLPYFCVPPNPKLLGYWDTIADRLFKIRHCMNIEGVVRQLPLFEPQIDPGLLVRAAAQGVDINSVLNDLNAPVPHYRFTTLLRQALELCAQLKSLGSALLVALEKQDGEALSRLRAGHETGLLALVKEVKKNQLLETQRVREGLDKTWELTETRRRFWETQLNENGNGRTGHEQEQQRLLDEAQDWQAASQALETAAGVAHHAPNITLGLSGTNTVSTVTLGGSTAGASLHAAANVLNYVASIHTYWATEAGMQASWERRARDWALQMQTAAKELEQIDKQKLAADIRIDIATQEIANHERQLENAREIEAFYRDKYTSEELYEWMSSELSALYFRNYQIAYDVAKRAERAYRFDLGLRDSDFVQFGYWDSLKKGLLAGDRLELALRQMECAYVQQHQREYEITKHVSLQLFDPMALIALKQTGICEVVLPESLFDADYPGHYVRRIKSVSLTIPCVVGPYTSVNCTLTLLNNKTRVKSAPDKPYDENADGNDDRFIDNFAAIQSIATSHGQNDSGLFELNFRDERYLPFEGAGAISRWRIELPRETNAFDPNSLSDAVLHVKYTARDGGGRLRTEALSAMRKSAAGDIDAPLMRLISLRHEFPDAWHRFGYPPDASSPSQELDIALSLERFPYQLRGRKLLASKLSIFLIFKNPSDIEEYTAGGKLRFTITPDGAPAWSTVKLTSTASVLSGTPMAKIEIDSGLALPSRLKLTITEQDVQLLAPTLRHQVPSSPTGRVRLRTDLLDDLLLVVNYLSS